MLRHFAIGLLSAVSVAAWGQAHGSTLYRVQASQVADALSRAGMDVTAREIKIGVDVLAGTPDPVLDVLDAESNRNAGFHPVWVKLACRDSAECRPFFIEVAWHGSLPELVKVKRTQMPIHAYQLPIIHFGDRATLVAEGPGSRLEIAVIALQNGSAGQVIQLATPDHKLFYRGVVVSKSMLKVSF